MGLKIIVKLFVKDDSLLSFNPLNAELDPICHLLALLAAHPILHISRISVKVMWTVEKQMIQSMNSSFIWILNFGCSRLVFLVFGVVIFPVPALIGNGSAQPEHRNTNRLRPKFRIHIDEEFTG